ncbi:hypothetical protein EJ07DRAFT_159946 [Lizonia empirigonia]|nr:hypothetical protein EJ07DRAFT_159946 [Lizonia empirigonia]
MSYSPSCTDEDVLADYSYLELVLQSGDLPYSELGSSHDAFAQWIEPLPEEDYEVNWSHGDVYYAPVPTCALGDEQMSTSEDFTSTHQLDFSSSAVSSTNASSVRPYSERILSTKSSSNTEYKEEFTAFTSADHDLSPFSHCSPRAATRTESLSYPIALRPLPLPSSPPSGETVFVTGEEYPYVRQGHDYPSAQVHEAHQDRKPYPSVEHVELPGDPGYNLGPTEFPRMGQVYQQIPGDHHDLVAQSLLQYQHIHSVPRPSESYQQAPMKRNNSFQYLESESSVGVEMSRTASMGSPM